MVGIHGVLLMATGMIHMIFGLLPFTYLHDWQKLFVLGLWDTVSKNDDRAMAAFCFVAEYFLC